MVKKKTALKKKTAVKEKTVLKTVDNIKVNNAPKGAPALLPPFSEEVLFHVSLRIADDHFETSAPTLLEALNKIEITRIKAKGKLVVTYGEKRTERLMPIWKLKMFNFKSEIPMLVLAKNLSMMLK
jgi:hypothetical protein